MGFYHLGLLTFLGVISMATVQGQSRIFFLGSDVIRPGTVYDATVTNLGIQPASVVVAIENNSTQTRIVDANKNIEIGVQEAFVLQIPADLDETGKYVVRVIEGNPPSVRYDNSTEVRVEKKSRSIFIVTDKAIYKPGATVYFRGFALNPNLRPRVEPLTVEIFDPKGNKIKQWLNQDGEMGVVSGELPLSTVTSLGNWKIKVTSGTEDQTQTFKVDEYVLPKFEVGVSLGPTFIVSSSDSMMPMIAEVSAKYTIGTPVDGDLRLTVRPERSWTGIKPTVINTKISGIRNVNISFPASTFESCGTCAMVVEASVVDSLSGENRTASTKFQTWENREKLDFLEGPEFIKPGLKSIYVLKITQQDGSPIADPKTKVLVTATQNFYSSNGLGVEKTPYSLPDNGLLEIEIDIWPNATSLRIEARYNKARATKSVNRVFKSFSNQSIEVERDSDPTIPYNLIRFKVGSTEDISNVYYQVLSKKRVEASGQSSLQTPGKDVTITIIASPRFAPSATILVYYINSDGEVIATSQRFSVPISFDNEVTMTWDQDRKKVQEQAILTVVAEPGSFVSVGAVDQSVLLLGESNDLTTDWVTEELESYDVKKEKSCCRPSPFGGRRFKRSFWFPFFSASDTATVIKSAGLVYMTDAFVYKTVQYDEGVRWDLPQARGRANVAFSVRKDAPSSTKKKAAPSLTETYVRSFFPESWFWNQTTAGPDGKVILNYTVPDTLTKWVTTSFALHPVSGLGIPSQRANLTAFLPFFMRVAKPYSVIRGEVITLRVLVFNYLGGTRDVTVTLQSSPEFTVRDSPNSVVGESKTVTQSVQVLDKKGGTVSFTIVPQKLGLIKLSLRGVTSDSGDSLEEPLLVEPEGRLVETNRAFYVKLEGGQPFTDSETVSFPQEQVVEGSRMIIVKAIGDLLGTTLEGLTRLVKQPYGCGEQNMITFTPNIFVRKYLERTNTLTSKVRADTTRYMEQGYMRELNYQRKDGSFSAFGDNDKAGSTWLTSFVIDSFKQAQPFIFVDDVVLKNSLTWLLTETYNSKEGTFREVGVVLHKEMQGGGSDSSTLTAYVLIALERCRSLNQSVPLLLDAITSARLTLEKSVETTSDLYKLAIIGYALQLTGSPLVDSVLQKLEAGAQGAGTGITYWKVTTDEEAQSCTGYCNRPNNQVELAAFVLLTYVSRKEVTKGLPVARFLISQKNPQGGFYSTQDTVWGLNALAEFSAATRTNGQQYTVTVSAGPTLKTEFNVNDANSQVLQSYEITDDMIDGNTIQVNVDVTGNGVGLVEVMSRYYTTKEEASKKLGLNVTSVSKNDKVQHITGCVSIIDKSLKDMIVLQLNDVSGFPIDKNSITAGGDIKLVEKEGKTTSIYFGDIPAGIPHCVTGIAYKEDEVENAKPPMARAFAYYSGDETSIVYMQNQARVETSTIVSTTKATSSSTRPQVCAFMSLLLTLVVLFSA